MGLVAPARAEDPAPPAPEVPAEELVPDAPPPAPTAPEADASSVGAIVQTADGPEVITVDAAPGTAGQVVADLERDPQVIDAFVDMPATIAATQPPPNAQWNVAELDLDEAPLPAGAPDGHTKVVAVVDTGVDAGHEDLQEPDPAHPGSTRSRVRCDLGADFTVTSQRSVGKGCTDPHGHGTHVAGILSAVAGNGIGIDGVSAAQIMPVRVLDANGKGLTSRIAAGIIWAVNHHASVINVSIVSGYTTAYDAAIQYALSKNVVVVAAAGNNRAVGNAKQSPSSNPGVISVAATDQAGLSAPFSYSGATNLIAAPGQDIWSTTPGGYEAMSGTSMSVPQVAGVIARYRGLGPHKNDTWRMIRDALKNTAIDLQVKDGWDADTGYGLLNPYKLLTGADAAAHGSRGIVATTPTGITVTARADGLNVSWRVPVYDGGSPITSYDVIAARAVGGDLEPVASVGTSGNQAVLGPDVGLTRGTTYYVVLRANNPAPGQTSLVSDAVRVPTAPTAPRIGTPNAGPGAARVRWSAPASTGGSRITGYIVKAYQGWVPVRVTTVPADAREVRLAGLTNGRAHTFLVQAVNAVGASGHSARSIAVTPRQVPSAPWIGRPSALNDAARVYWTAPKSNGGAYISAYVVRAWQGTRLVTSLTVSGASSNALVTGLGNRGYYSFTVSAKNVVGLSAPSARSATIRTT